MLLCLKNRSSLNKLLKTDEAGKAFNVTENETNCITDIFFLKHYLDLGLLRLSSWKFLFEYFFKEFFFKHSEGIFLEERSVREIPTALGITALYSKQSLEIARDPLECKSKVSQKSCCNDLERELTLERDFTKAANASVWSWFFIKKSMKAFCTSMLH